MKDIPEPLLFDWDKGNIDKNFFTHGVTNKEVEAVFTNEPLLVFPDVRHSAQEERLEALGKTDEGRRLFVVFTIRKKKVRIISARDMNRKEEAMYENI